MAGGWGGSLMRKEDEFLVLDGMYVLSVITATITGERFRWPAHNKQQDDCNRDPQFHRFTSGFLLPRHEEEPARSAGALTD